MGYQEILRAVRASHPEIQPLKLRNFKATSAEVDGDTAMLAGLDGKLMDHNVELTLEDALGREATAKDLSHEPVSIRTGESWINSARPADASVLLAGDSFCIALAPILEQGFGRVARVHDLKPTPEEVLPWMERFLPSCRERLPMPWGPRKNGV